MFECVVPGCPNKRSEYNAYCSINCQSFDPQRNYAATRGLYEYEGYYGPPWPNGLYSRSLSFNSHNSDEVSDYSDDSDYMNDDIHETEQNPSISSGFSSRENIIISDDSFCKSENSDDVELVSIIPASQSRNSQFSQSQTHNNIFINKPFTPKNGMKRQRQWETSYKKKLKKSKQLTLLDVYSGKSS
jgi:hypothetical protein